MGFIIATLIVLVVIASALAQDFSIFSWAYWQEGGGGASRSEIARNFLLALAAFIGLGFGIWRAVTAHRQTRAAQGQASAATEQARVANEQARIAQQGQFTERFSRAAEHLGSGQLPVRLGGIYALWRLAQDSPERDAIPVVDILCAFVRDPPPIEPPPSTGEAGAAQPGQNPSDAATKLRPDVQGVLKLLGDSAASYRQHLPTGYRLDLSRADLMDAELPGVDLSSADLSGAELSGAMLSRANLSRANLSGADLSGAQLTVANLSRATLWSADLRSAQLARADLSRAELDGADLSRAAFWHANLSGASLSDAKLTRANLSGADLSRATLLSADLTNARLSRADFSRAELSGAEGLIQAQLEGIRYDPDNPPKLPPGLVLPELLPKPKAENDSETPAPPET